LKSRLLSILFLAVGLALPAAAQAAGPPVVTSTSASGVGETSATLNGALDPNGTRAKAHFEYLSEAEYIAAGNSFSGATPAPAKDIIVDNQVEGTGKAEAGSGAIRGVSAEKGTFVPGQLIKAKDVLPTGTTINSVEADPAAPGKQILYLSAKALETKAGATFTATGGAATGSGDISFESPQVKSLATASGTFTPGQSVSGPGIPANTIISEVPGPTELILSRPATESATVVPLTAASGQPLSTTVEGLIPQTKYLLRLVAERTNGSERVVGPVTTFYTLAPVPTFEDCPANEPFRSGTFAPFGQPSDALPDCRSYEQASPVNKNGGDVLGEVQFSKAAEDGSSVTFGSSFGVPGAEGAQERPFYLATRGGEGGWNTTGLMPPASAGEKAQPLAGWSPNFENAYAIASRPKEALNLVLKQALFELHRDGTGPTQITPYIFQPSAGLGASYFVGTSADLSTVLTESFGQLPQAPGQLPIALASPGNYNVYAWDRATQELHLASVMNTDVETKAMLPKGAFAGPYDWMRPDTHSGGAVSKYYLRDERAVSSDGSVFFTAAGSGQLYQRINPTAAQSNPGPNGYVEDGHCFEPAKACTVHISASEKTNGISPDGKDPAGPQPAAFQAASADGSVSYFTSSEKLTDDANTGPEQPPAQIGVADLSDPDPNATKDESFLPTHAKGLATSPDGEYLYWVDPSKNSIGRAKLNPDGSHGTVEDDFILPGETEVELTPEIGSPEVLKGPSTPQYVAVGPCAEGGECVYWTNTGPVTTKGLGAPYFSSPGEPVRTGGTVGRAVLDGSGDVIPESVDSDFVSGASNPQGIAVNSEYVYWADTGMGNGNDVARATLDGESINLHFLHPALSSNPWGVALDADHIYVSTNDAENHSGYVMRFSLTGGEREQLLPFSPDGIREVTVDDTHVYWANQSETAIGRADLDLGNPSKQFIQIQGGPDGLARDSANLYWTTNGEAPTNPGNDLYRHSRIGIGGCDEPTGCLEDLTPDSADPNGAEVQGVLGTSTDGSYVYFAANADLDGAGPANDGTCHGPSKSFGGNCSLYLWHDGSTQFVARLHLGGRLTGDATNWLQTPVSEIASNGNYTEKTSFISPDGQALVFRSGSSYLRYEVGEGLACLTCGPSGADPGGGGLQSAQVNNGLASSLSSSVQSHHLSADGDRFFFQTTSPLVAGDVNGANGCPNVGSGNQFFFSCQDVYEWEAPGAGTCTEGGPAYSPANQGCLYLISTGKSNYPSFFVDASSSGNDVFFLTRDQLVGQDTDQLQDVYDARVNGGLTSQNQPPSIPCENEGCKNEAGPPPQFSAPPQISGPGNPPIKRKPCKPKKGKKACGKKHKPRHHKRHHHKGAKR
jgi:sugar lactone lactonase YvrE